MPARWFNRGAVAIGLSLALHIVLFASRMPERGAFVDHPELTSVELITLAAHEDEPVDPPSEPEIPAPLKAPNETHEKRHRPLQLAARLDVRPQPEPAPAPAPEPVPESVPGEPESIPDPVVIPVIPSPREVARKLAVRQIPRLPTAREKVEGRVVALMKQSLPPRLNDRSSLPDFRTDSEGNLIHEDGAFVAIIAPDGSVSFRRRRGMGLDQLAEKSPDPEEQDILDMHTRLPYVPLLVRKATEADRAQGNAVDKAGLGLGFRFYSDLNDAVLRARDEDPLAAKKRRFLRLTQQMRDEMMLRARQQRLALANLWASRNTEEIWSDETLGFTSKRQTLFHLWDECDEPQSDRDDRAEAKAGQRARDLILRFIQAKLPHGTSQAFSQAEIRQFNAIRQSKQTFCPY